MRTELFIILLRVHRDVLTDLCLHLLQQPRLLTILQPIISIPFPTIQTDGCSWWGAHSPPPQSCRKPLSKRVHIYVGWHGWQVSLQLCKITTVNKYSSYKFGETAQHCVCQYNNLINDVLFCNFIFLPKICNQCWLQTSAKHLGLSCSA